MGVYECALSLLVVSLVLSWWFYLWFADGVGVNVVMCILICTCDYFIYCDLLLFVVNYYFVLYCL